METDKQRLERLEHMPLYDINQEDHDWLISQVEQRQWIPVSERLPDTKDYYLVWTGGDVFELLWLGDHWSQDTTVKAWMPLPAPPQEADDGSA